MKSLHPGKSIALLALALLPAAGVWGAESHGTATTLRGEVLDLACYIGHGAKGEDHASCARKCLQGGQPMGLLAEDGTVIILSADHADGSAYEKTREFAGRKVEIKGDLASRSGVKGIAVRSVKPL